MQKSDFKASFCVSDNYVESAQNNSSNLIQDSNIASKNNNSNNNSQKENIKWYIEIPSINLKAEIYE